MPIVALSTHNRNCAKKMHHWIVEVLKVKGQKCDKLPPKIV